MSGGFSRAGLVTSLVSMVWMVFGVVEPAGAAASVVTVLNSTVISSSGTTLSTGDSISLAVCAVLAHAVGHRCLCQLM